jgi:hypothetical protein
MDFHDVVLNTCLPACLRRLYVHHMSIFFHAWLFMPKVPNMEKFAIAMLETHFSKEALSQWIDLSNVVLLVVCPLKRNVPSRRLLNLFSVAGVSIVICLRVSLCFCFVVLCCVLFCLLDCLSV